MKFRDLIAAAVAMSILLSPPSLVRGADAPPLTRWVLRQVGRPGGILALPRCRDGSLALSLAAESPMVIFAQHDDADALTALRRKALAEGLLGKDLYLAEGAFDRLHLAPAAADAVVVADLTDGDLDEMDPNALVRALAPANGRALLGRPEPAGKLSEARLKRFAEGMSGVESRIVREGEGMWLLARRDVLPGSDDWTHRWHGPDNNPMSGDTAIKTPLITQWLGKPYNHTARGNTELIAGGRLLVASRARFVYQAGMRRNDIFTMFNLYNGRLLWKRPLPETFYTGFSSMVLTPDKLYMILGAKIAVLDPETGERVRDIPLAGSDGHAKWIALVDGKLLVLVGRKDMGTTLPPPDEPVSTKTINETNKTVTLTGRTFLAIDPAGGETLWTHECDGDVSVRMIGVGHGRVYYVATGKEVAAVSVADGMRVWRSTDETLLSLTTEKSELFDGIVNARERGVTVLERAVIVGSRGTRHIVSLDPATGRMLWQKVIDRKKGFRDRGRIARWLGVNGNLHTLGRVIDARTGKTLDERRVPAGGCGIVTGTPGFLWGNCGLCYNLRSDRQLPAYASLHKTPCDVGTFVAGGVAYSSSGPCTCGLVSRGLKGQMFAGDFRPGGEADAATRLTRYEHHADIHPLAADGKDWPVPRGNARRSGSTTVNVPATLALLWRADAPNPGLYRQAMLERYYQAEMRPTPPVAVGDQVFVASTDGTVRCLGAGGRAGWTAFTEGPVLLAPTFHNGRLFVGSCDGHVYCLEAATGRRLWRFRAAPVERRTTIYQQLSSLWPVTSGLAVRDGTVYFAAGLLAQEGSHFYALDARDGSILWQRNDLAPDAGLRGMGRAPSGGVVVHAGRVWFNCANIAHTSFDAKTGELFDLPEAMRSIRKPQGALGCDIGVYPGGMIFYGGQRLFADTYERNGSRFKIARWAEFAHLPLDANGRPTYPEVSLLPTGLLTPAWDEELTVAAPMYRRRIEAWNTSGTIALIRRMRQENIDTEYPFYRHSRASLPAAGRKKNPDVPMKRWGPLDVDASAVVLAGNAVVVAWGAGKDDDGLHTDWKLSVLDRQDGEALASVDLPAEPVPNGLAIDRQGRILVTCRTGEVLCYGTK